MTTEGYHGKEIGLLNANLNGHESASGPNLKPKLFPEGLAPLEVFEEMIQNADHDCIDAHALLLSRLLESEACFRPHMEHLGVRERKAGLPGLQDHDVVHLYMFQSKEDDPGKVAFDARLLGYCFSQVDGKTERQAGSFVGRWLCFGFRRSAFLGYHHM
jgi:hypothetical protein